MQNMTRTSKTIHEIHKSEQNENMPPNTNPPSVKPPKTEHRERASQAVKPSREEQKSKKRKRGQPEPNVEPNGLHNEELGVVTSEQLKDDNKKKPKRLKKSKHVQQQEEEPVDPDEETRIMKHGAIFSKYQKSAQLAEAEKKSAPPLAEQEDLAPPAVKPELHGESRILNLRR
jgi:hypothetical protein